MNPSRKAVFFGEFARLSAAAIPVDKSLRLLMRHAPRGPLRSALRGMEAALASGATIAGAMAPALTPLESGIIKAAEQSGQLAAGFAHLEKWYDAQARARSAALHAMAYPLLIAHVAAIIPVILRSVSSDSPILLPLLGSLATLWGVLLMLWLLCRVILSIARHSRLADAIISAIPWVGSAWSRSGLARWAAVMQFHLQSGQLMSGAFEEAAAAADRPRLRKASLRLARLTASGQPAGPAMCRESIFPEEVSLHFASAEEAGMLDVECARMATRALHDATTAVQRAGEWIPRIVYAGAMGFAAWQILRMGAGIISQQQNFMRDLGL